ncbi:MAG: pilus assembly protein PilM [Candidatus Omnitrophica bacterium]|nr:pilus assembly protein PilM [Candidatus Omnitrophota bacterium]
MKRKIGIYLGVNSIGGTVVVNKKVVETATFDLSSVEDEASVENLNDEVRWEALINKLLRQLGVDETEVNLSIADRDFVLRSFEMPLMRKKEIDASIVYEAEKFIPFKIDEIQWDYGFYRSLKDKKVKISFVSMQEDRYQQFQKIFSHLGITPAVIEPSFLSVVRNLKSLKQVSQVKDFAVLDFTSLEAYITFFNNDLPVFNRYLAMSSVETVEIDKLVEAVRMSFQYFNREFGSADINKLFVLCSPAYGDFITALKEEVQVEVEFITPQEFLPQASPAVEDVKALGVAGIDYLPYKFKPVLKKAGAPVEEEEEIDHAPIKVVEFVPLRWGLFFGIIFMTAMAYLFISLIMGNNVNNKLYDLKQAYSKLEIPTKLAKYETDELRRVDSKGVYSQYDWKDIEKDFQGLTKRIDILKGHLEGQKAVSGALEKVSTLRSDGLWFERFSLRTESGKLVSDIEGMVFLGDPFQEDLSLDAYIMKLENDPEIMKLFAKVDKEMVSSRNVRKYNVTSFKIKLR